MLPIFIICLFMLPLTMGSLPSMAMNNNTMASPPSMAMKNNTMASPPSMASPLSTAMNNISKPNCSTHCGDITIPYPFGIDNCSFGYGFTVICNTTYNPPKLYWEYNDLEIFNISDSELRIQTNASYRCYTESGLVNDAFDWYDYFYQFPFSEKNKLTVLGCDDYAIQGNFSTGCFGLCSKKEDVSNNGQCLGKGCCQTSIQTGTYYYDIELGSLKNHTNVLSFSRCGVAFVGEEGSFKFHGLRDLSDLTGLVKRINSTVPLVLDWVIQDTNCTEATECQGNSSCYDVKGGGYRCRCNEGYEGNPYLDPGCQDINECEVGNYCHGICNNIPGGYNCSCPRGQVGNARILDGCEPGEHNKSRSILIFSLLGVAMGIGVLGISIWMFKAVQRRKNKKQKEKFFKRNGGLLLKCRLSSGNEVVDHPTRLFSATELEKATGKFSDHRKVGEGGQGVVYKGMLADGMIVAVKKSMLVDESQVDIFINEVFILSEINHKNVVKLLGCCLETEVPMLVYEFIPNGTLDDFIHDEDYEFPTFWKIRLQIATEIARGLAYLHSETSIPVFHRDIKSSNILLDEKFRAKISDFGISKSFSKNQTHVSTLAKGTLGYLDPEYYQTNHLTDKSDVYSFGIVLLELLTGKKPIFTTPSGENKGLATFILPMDYEEVLQNVDSRVSESPKEQLIAFANLARRCLNLNGTLRPNMEEVATILEGLKTNG